LSVFEIQLSVQSALESQFHLFNQFDLLDVRRVFSTAFHTELGVWLMLLIAIVLGSLSMAMNPLPEDVPLPWDMAHHTLRGTRMANALRELDSFAIVSNLRFWDVYPPATYVELGLIQAVVSSDAVAWELLVVLSWCWIAIALRVGFDANRLQLGILTLLFMTGNSFLFSLSGQRMLDFYAAVAALLSLALLVRLYNDARPRTFLLAVLGLCFVLLTKHNAGLPCAAVAMAFAAYGWLGRRRRSALLLLLAALLSLGIWAAFLTWQDHGWEAFLSFAKNRSNSEGLAIWQRGARYLAFIYNHSYGGWWVGAPVLTLTLLGLFSRSRFAWACFLYAAATFVAISWHPYFLSRNFTTGAMALCVPAACGAWLLLGTMFKSETKRSPGLGFVVLLLSIHLFSTSRGLAKAQTEHQFTSNIEALSPVSETLESWLGGRGNVLVLGTFNELSKPWVTALYERNRSKGSHLMVDLYYPLKPSPRGLDARWDPKYASVLSRITAEHGTTDVIAIRHLPDSPWKGGDYRAWNAFKGNYIRCVELSKRFLPVERVAFPEAGIELSRFTSAFIPVEFGEGWRGKENWGRWMAESVATIRLPAIDKPSTLVVEIAPHHEQVRPIRLQITVSQLKTALLEISGYAWHFQRHEFALPALVGQTEVSLEVLDDGREHPSDGRLVPFRTLEVLLK